MELTVKPVSKMNFQVNSFPNTERMAGLAILSGIPPSKIPCGQRYLQKYGGDIPVLSTRKTPSSQTIPIKMMYFR